MAKAEGIGRREVLVAGVAGVACCMAPQLAWAIDESELPQKGDKLVIDGGPNDGKLASVETVTVGGGIVNVIPMDASGKKKTSSRFAKVLLVRLAPEDYPEEVRKDTAEGIVALSSICTHQGCGVATYLPAEKKLVCFCHHSEFKPAEGGEVAHGPARKKLPQLPIAKADDGTLVVTADFNAKPGPPTPA